MPGAKKSHRQGWLGVPDEMEVSIERWLIARGIAFTRDHPSRLDFYLPELDLLIEVKRFYTPRIADQLSRVPASSVLVIQGIETFLKLQLLLGEGGSICQQVPKLKPESPHTVGRCTLNRIQ